MKKLAIVALCFFSSFSQASDIEEVVVVARQIRVVLLSIADTHRFDAKTQSWHYDASKEKAALAKLEREEKHKD